MFSVLLFFPSFAFHLFMLYDIYLISFLIILAIVLLNMLLVVLISLELFNVGAHVLVSKEIFAFSLLQIFWIFLLICYANIILFKVFQQLIYSFLIYIQVSVLSKPEIWLLHPAKFINLKLIRIKRNMGRSYLKTWAIIILAGCAQGLSFLM